MQPGLSQLRKASELAVSDQYQKPLTGLGKSHLHREFQVQMSKQ